MRKSARGFTLVELMMGLFITSITGMAVAGVSMVLSTAYSHSENHYDAIESARSAIRRAQFSLQSASLVTAVDSGGTKLAYWTGDDNSDGEINLLELRLLAYDPADKELTEYRVEFPGWWSEDYIKSKNNNFNLKDAVVISNVEGWILGSLYRKSLLYATDVESFHVSVAPDAPLTTLVEMQIGFGVGDQAVAFRGAAALRADATKYVGLAGSDYVLTIP